MASPTYKARAMVLRKTKLGESDLILTFLTQEGSQVRAVAKGARKPASAFSARLELYSVVDVMCAKGRSLDVVSEARLVASNEHLRLDLEHAAAAAPMAELLDRVTQEGLENPKLFACTEAAFACMGDLPGSQAPLVCAAHLLKTLAFSGLRPSLDVCAVCGAVAGEGGRVAVFEAAELSTEEAAPVAASSGAGRLASAGALAFSLSGESVPLSYREGGVVCNRCRRQVETILLPAATLDWMRYLLGSTFADIAAAEPALDAAFAVLHFCREWVREHVGCTLKSLEFLLSCGLYDIAAATHGDA